MQKENVTTYVDYLQKIKQLALLVASGSFLFFSFLNLTACADKKVEDTFPVGSLWSSIEFTSDNQRITQAKDRYLLEFTEKSVFIKLDNSCYKNKNAGFVIENLDDINKFFLIYKFDYTYKDNFLTISNKGHLTTDATYQDYGKPQICKNLSSENYKIVNLTDVLNLDGDDGFTFKKDAKTIVLNVKSYNNIYLNRIK